MRYLKPELLTRCRSLDDEVAEAAANEWDQAIARYNARLATLRPLLPTGVQAVLDHFSLHDGRVLGISLARRKTWLSLLVRLEGTSVRPGPVLELKYILAKGLKRAAFAIMRHGGAEQGSQDRGRIQYDEFGKVGGVGVGVFSHSLLLTGGFELRIRFTNLRVRRLNRVILPSVELAGLETA